MGVEVQAAAGLDTVRLRDGVGDDDFEHGRATGGHGGGGRQAAGDKAGVFPEAVDELDVGARPVSAAGGWLPGSAGKKVDERPKWTMEVMRSPACACSRPSVVSRRKAYSRSVTRPEEERTRRSRSSFASSRRAYSRPRSRMASE
ncbi:MAG: hypothetical protein IPG47_06435 [Thermoflexaceae bacterium]|nr:hypothetical protein [Thermoflexaceae bacterium]